MYRGGGGRVKQRSVKQRASLRVCKGFQELPTCICKNASSILNNKKKTSSQKKISHCYFFISVLKKKKQPRKKIFLLVLKNINRRQRNKYMWAGLFTGKWARKRSLRDEILSRVTKRRAEISCLGAITRPSKVSGVEVEILD